MTGEIPADATVIKWKLNFNKPIKNLDAAMDLSIIYVSVEGDTYLYCLNLHGRVLWKYNIPSGIKSISADIEGKHVAVSSNKGGLFYIDAKGNLLWSYSLGRDIPVHKVSHDGSIVVAGTITASGAPTMCLLSREGKVIRHLSMPGRLKKIDTSYDGSAIVIGDVKNNIALYDKKGNKQWIYNMGKTLHDIKLSQNGLHVFVVTDVLQSVSPSGKPRWKIEVPGGPITHIEMSHDCSVNIVATKTNLFRYEMKGKMLWNRENPQQFKSFRLSYRSYHIVMNNTNEIEYWDKYGYGIFSFELPRGFVIKANNFAVSHNGRFIVCGTENGYVVQFDTGKALANHLIEASKIFIEELKRFGSMPPDAEDNLQWAIESFDEGDIEHAIMYGMQAYSGLENMLDSISKEKAAPKVKEEKEIEIAEVSREELIEKYRKALDAVFKDKEEPTESELVLLSILRETLGITIEEHNEIEEEVKSRLAPPPPSIPPPISEPSTELAESTETSASESTETVSEPETSIESLLKIDVKKDDEVIPDTLPEASTSEEGTPLLKEEKEEAPAPSIKDAPEKEDEKKEEFDMDTYVSSILGKYLKK